MIQDFFKNQLASEHCAALSNSINVNHNISKILFVIGSYEYLEKLEGKKR